MGGTNLINSASVRRFEQDDYSHRPETAKWNGDLPSFHRLEYMSQE